MSRRHNAAWAASIAFVTLGCMTEAGAVVTAIAAEPGMLPELMKGFAVGAGMTAIGAGMSALLAITDTIARRRERRRRWGRAR